VNRKFAEAVADETPPNGIVFFQDYHLCLAAKYLKEKRSDLTTVLFWHIPWPNPEIFRICPWKKEILEGLLANDIVGFHLRYHANNFAETVDQELESRIDWKKMKIQRKESSTIVSSYPISVDFSSIVRLSMDPEVRRTERELIEEFDLEGKKVGLGVDRLDYTKGIPERLDALERLFEKYPSYIGKLVFIQIGVPSRTHIEDYREVIARIEIKTEEINRRFGNRTWEPIKFLKGRKNFDDLIPFYRLSDFCIVSSLHDGMNLVAKEYVAASYDGHGVLLLSGFTGAARELEQPRSSIPTTPKLHRIAQGGVGDARGGAETEARQNEDDRSGEQHLFLGPGDTHQRRSARRGRVHRGAVGRMMDSGTACKKPSLSGRMFFPRSSPPRPASSPSTSTARFPPWRPLRRRRRSLP
jgi:trehalose 6-phosphate synthase